MRPAAAAGAALCAALCAASPPAGSGSSPMSVHVQVHPHHKMGPGACMHTALSRAVLRRSGDGGTFGFPVVAPATCMLTWHLPTTTLNSGEEVYVHIAGGELIRGMLPASGSAAFHALLTRSHLQAYDEKVRRSEERQDAAFHAKVQRTTWMRLLAGALDLLLWALMAVAAACAALVAAACVVRVWREIAGWRAAGHVAAPRRGPSVRQLPLFIGIPVPVPFWAPRAPPPQLDMFADTPLNGPIVEEIDDETSIKAAVE